ncbi:MAG: aminotransferase class V-fold PLP-dependent enzyme [Anaerolineae bacterium]|nr:aminotransferase class V-fold PLP-dependent enzyme [Anaerolineae bacterium]
MTVNLPVISIHRPVSPFDKAWSAFQSLYPAYANTRVLDELRRREYGRLDNQGHVYLDYTGGSLYAKSQLTAHHALLNHHVFGNPHSQNPTSLAMTERVEQGRRTILDYFNASPEEYVVIFTANASGAIKLVGEAYPFTGQSHYLLTADNHNSINGIRQFAEAKGAQISYIPVVPPELCLDLATIPEYLRLGRPQAPNLLAFPAQSNFSGVQHPLELIQVAHARGWDVLLDAASFAPTNRLDVSRWQPDFVTLSFYKIFGYPTGIGCLLARRSALAKLQRPWFAGGAVSLVSVRSQHHLMAPDEMGYEDGTVNYINIPAVEIGLKYVRRISMDVIHTRVQILTEWLIDRLLKLQHQNGHPLVYLHGPKEMQRRGGTLAMNFYDPAGVPFNVFVVEQLANKANISLRTGCFCNPGASEFAHGLDAQQLDTFWQSCPTPTPASLNEYMLAQHTRAVGATRVSVGLVSNFADVYKFIVFARSFLNRSVSAM